MAERAFPQLAATRAQVGTFLPQQVFLGEIGEREIEAEAADDVLQAVVIQRGDGAHQRGAALRVGIVAFFDKALAQVFDGLQGLRARLAFDDLAQQSGKQTDAGAQQFGIGGGGHHDVSPVFVNVWRAIINFF